MNVSCSRISSTQSSSCSKHRRSAVVMGSRSLCACLAQGVAGSNPVAPTTFLRNLHKHNDYGHLTRRLSADVRCRLSPQIATFCLGLGPNLGPQESHLSEANQGGC